jgi:hydroxyacyl-ACP dehydratase HTD2-like protein with hotdog domain
MQQSDVERLLQLARSQAGQEHRAYLGSIPRLLVQRFAAAIGDADPLYWDTAAARAAGYPDIIAPPTMLTSIRGWTGGPLEDELRPDGSVPETEVYLPGVRRMGAGQRVEIVSQTHPGDEISVVQRIIGAYAKDGRSGPLVFLETESEYLGHDDEVRSRHRRTVVLR